MGPVGYLVAVTCTRLSTEVLGGPPPGVLGRSLKPWLRENAILRRTAVTSKLSADARPGQAASSSTCVLCRQTWFGLEHPGKALPLSARLSGALRATPAPLVREELGGVATLHGESSQGAAARASRCLSWWPQALNTCLLPTSSVFLETFRVFEFRLLEFSRTHAVK